MALEFLIPLHRSDLKVDKKAENEFSQVANLVALISKELEMSFKEGSKSIVNQFEKCCYIIMHINEFDKKDLSKLVTILTTILLQEKNLLDSSLNSASGSADKKSHRNSLKMVCFVACSIVEELISMDDLSSKKGKNLNPRRTTTKKAAKSHTTEPTLDDYSGLLERFIGALFKIFETNVHYLWEPPVIDDEFFRLLINHCFKLTESVSVCKNKTLLKSIAKLLALFIEKHNTKLSIALKIVKNLQTFEHLSLPYAQMVDIFVREYKLESFLLHLFKEISQIDSDCGANNEIVGAKAISEFLTNIVAFVPIAVHHYISILIPFLEKDPYCLRNAVLDCLYTLITEVLTNEDNESHKVTRLSFLKKLQDHIIDVNAFVRSHTLKLWSNLAFKQLIPLSMYNDVVEACCSRLVDKACNVRKNAVAILKHVLEQNPFSANLNIELLKSNLENEEKRLSFIVDASKKLTQPDADKDIINWEALIEPLTTTVQTYTSSLNDQNETIVEEKYKSLTDGVGLSECLNRIYLLLCDGQLGDAVELLFAARSTYEEESLFLDETDDLKLLELIFNGIKHSDKETKEIIEENRLTGSSSNNTSQLNHDNDRQQLETARLLDQNQLTIRKQQILVRYIKDSLHFATLINTSMKILSKLMHSETQSDKFEVIEFFVFAVQFGVISFVAAIDTLLPLIWTKENNLKECLVESLHKLIFHCNHNNNNNFQQLNNGDNNTVLELIRNLTIGRNFALTELFSCFSKKSMIPQWFVDMILECVAGKTMPNCKRAMIVLGMIARNEPDIVFDNLELIIRAGISSQNPLYTRETCVTVWCAFRSKSLSKNKTYNTYRLASEHVLFSTLLRVLLKTIDDPTQNHWIPMMESVCQLIVFAADQPLKTLFLYLNEVTTQPNIAKSVLHLTRVVSMGGHCALCILTLLHGPLSEELRRRRNMLNPEHKKSKNTSTLIHQNTTMNTTSATAGERSTLNTDEEFNGLVMGASADDLIVEWVDNVCEYNLFSENSILQVYLKIIYNCLESSHDSVREHVPLQNACVTALGKFMLLSSSVCAEFLPLLLKQISQNNHESVICNGLIICGDIALRFPNIIEPFTSQLFLNLKSDSVGIRRTTVTVLCHLILNDMIKIKGQISELALRIGDPDKQISSKVVHFFHELSRKENAIYNILPDLVSRLSDDQNVTRDTFESVIKFLFKFLQKDRHCEMFMEKLCHRIPATENHDQLDLFLYCMRNIPLVGERAIKKLLQTFDSYKDKFVIDSVRDTFTCIIATARKQCKDGVGSSKASIDELETKIRNVCLAFANQSSTDNAAPIGANECVIDDPTTTAALDPLTTDENDKPNFFASPIVDARQHSSSLNNSQHTPKSSSLLTKSTKKRHKFLIEDEDI